jgi:hypothetical protein
MIATCRRTTTKRDVMALDGFAHTCYDLYVAHYPSEANSVAVTTTIRCLFPHEFAHANNRFIELM